MLAVLLLAGAEECDGTEPPLGDLLAGARDAEPVPSSRLDPPAGCCPLMSGSADNLNTPIANVGAKRSAEKQKSFACISVTNAACAHSMLFPDPG